MKKMLLTLFAVLVLATPALAIELYWDDDWETSEGYLPGIYKPAVLFNDAGGTGQPGDTDGEVGIIESLRVYFYFGGCDLSGLEIYIYSVAGGNPGEPLAGPLPFTSVSDYPWTQLYLDEPVEVPGEFFVVLIGGWEQAVTEDSTEDDWPEYHSRFYSGSHWSSRTHDLRIRIEWETDTEPPYVADMEPTDGESDAPIDSTIVFHCKDDGVGVDSTTVVFTAEDSSLSSGPAISIGALNGLIAGDLYIDNSDPNDILCAFIPDEDLPYGDMITCTVDGDLADSQGNEMGEDFVWSFTTEDCRVEEATWGEIKASF